MPRENHMNIILSVLLSTFFSLPHACKFPGAFAKKKLSYSLYLIFLSIVLPKQGDKKKVVGVRESCKRKFHEVKSSIFGDVTMMKSWKRCGTWWTFQPPQKKNLSFVAMKSILRLWLNLIPISAFNFVYFSSSHSDWRVYLNDTSSVWSGEFFLCFPSNFFM